MENVAIIALNGTDIAKADIISSRVGNSMVAGYLLAQGNELRKRMQTSVVEFWFSKKDGSVRHAFGTTMGHWQRLTQSEEQGQASRSFRSLMLRPESGVVASFRASSRSASVFNRQT